MGISATEGNIKGLDRHGPVFKALFLRVEPGCKNFITECLFPVMREPTRMEFIHEFCEGKSGESLSVDSDPIADEIVFKAAKNMRDLHVVFNATFRVNEVIKAVVFKVFDRFGRNFAA